MRTRLEDTSLYLAQLLTASGAPSIEMRDWDFADDEYEPAAEQYLVVKGINERHGGFEIIPVKHPTSIHAFVQWVLLQVEPKQAYAQEIQRFSSLFDAINFVAGWHRGFLAGRNDASQRRGSGF